MNSDILEGRWNQIQGSIKERWGRLTEDDLAQSEGRYDRLIGALQEKYGYSKERAQEEVATFMDSLMTNL